MAIIKNILTELLTGPLSLPLDPIGVYITGAILVYIVWKTTYSIVGFLYDVTGIRGKGFGSLMYLLIYFILYALMYLVVFVVLTVIDFIFSNILNIFIAFVSVICLSGLIYFESKNKDA